MKRLQNLIARAAVVLAIGAVAFAAPARAEEAEAAEAAAEATAPDSGEIPAAPSESPAEEAPAEASAAEATPAEATPAEATPEAAPAATPAEATATPAAVTGKLDPISGVRLGASGRRQDVHIIIQRRERAEGKHELALQLPVQVNGKFTEHLGTGLEYSYHLREAFALTLGGTYYVRGVQSSFTDDELIAKAKQQPLAASALLQIWDARAGFELAPIYGKFALFNHRVVQFGFYIGTAAGVTQTRIQLRPPDADPPQGTGRGRTFGDTGLRPIGLFNAGLRMFFGDHVALRMEIRNTMYSDAVTSINGCTANELHKVQDNNLDVSASCEHAKFVDRKADAYIAWGLVKDPSSDILNNVSFVSALSVLF